jgi:PhnB protein
MASVSTYLNFPGNTQAAFEFYRSVFGTQFDTQYSSNGIMRMGDVPPAPGQPSLSEADQQLVMHVCLPILAGHLLMGTDATESMGMKLTFGNNSSINLQPDTRVDTDRLFARLAAGGKVDMPLAEMFWGDYFGSLTDKFGVQWMFNCASKA